MRQIKILVVDDEQSIRLMMRLILHKQYELVFASSGEEALRVFDSHIIDVVLLDILMPELDGFAVGQEIRQHSNVPIVMCSALSRPEDMAQAVGIGANGYIIKPFSAHELHKAITSALQPTNSRTDMK